MHHCGYWNEACRRRPRRNIRATVREHLEEMRFCYEQGRRRAPDLEGRVLLGWTIDDDGRVSDVDVVESSLPDDIVTACLRAAPRRWRFESGFGVQRVEYPFQLRLR